MLRLILLLLALKSGLTAAELTVTISHQYEGVPVHLDSFRYNTTTSETYALTRLSYILSGFKLQKPDGTLHLLPNQHAWIDLKHNTTLTLKNIPPGTYTSLHFHVGLDKKTNHLDPIKYPANHPLSSLRNLHWDWAQGYIFLAIEGNQLITPKVKKGFVYHLANDQNLTPIKLTHPLNIKDHTTANLTLDLKKLLNSKDYPISFLTDGYISHSEKNDTIATKLSQNLTNTFSITSTKNLPLSSPSTNSNKKITPLHLPKTFTPYPFTIPRHIPIPELPRDNPLTNERVALGKTLFHDTRLSKDNSISCASCHQHNHALSDPRAKSIGVNQAQSLRNSMPLQNLAWKTKFFWDGRATTLRQQILFPLTDPSEMHQDLTILPAKLTSLAPLFKKAFGTTEITTEKITLALEAHLLTLTSLDSKFDQTTKGNTTLTEQEQRGLKLFFTENNPRTRSRGADCFHCHNGPLFTDNSFHDTGLPSPTDNGLQRITNKPTDQFKFLTPSLRNIALTAPYMHDGRHKTLEQVIDHYNHTHTKTPNLDPNLSKHGTQGLQLTHQDKADLIAFLKTLTDPKFTTPP